MSDQEQAVPETETPAVAETPVEAEEKSPEEEAPKEEEAEQEEAEKMEVEQEEEAEQEEEEASKASKKAPPSTAVRSSRPRRERKQAQRFEPTKSFGTKKVIEIAEGAGTALFEHENVVQNLKSCKSDQPVIKNLHRLLFGSPGRKLEAKRNIRNFSGFADTPDEFEDHKKSQMDKLKSQDLVNIAKLLDAREASKGNKEDVIEALYEFLLDPQPSEGEGLTPHKGSAARSAGSKRKRSKSKKKKTGPTKTSGYRLYGAYIRPKIVEDNEGISPTDAMREIGSSWRDLGDKGQAKWKTKADKINAAGGVPAKKPAKKKPTKKKSATKKKAKKKQKLASSDTEDESSEEEEYSGLEKKLRAAIKKILNKAFEADQEAVKSKDVRKTLKKTFGDVIDTKKDWVKGMIRDVYESLESE